MNKFSILMSIYKNEKEEYARQCFESLISQTVQANEWVIVEDGLLTDKLYALLDEYQQKYPGLIKRVPFKKNRGLGPALRDGVVECSNELIARMDTDDIARNDRFEIQLDIFQKYPNVDICGSHIKEFDNNINNILAERKVPLLDAEIKKYHRKRDAFNHVTVMYKRSTVLKSGNYQECPLMEDTLLWANMFIFGAIGFNCDDYLVYARTGADMYERRGGLDYFRKYKFGRGKVYQTGFLSRWDYYTTLFIQFLIALMPNKLRGWIYNNLLRN